VFNCFALLQLLQIRLVANGDLLRITAAHVFTGSMTFSRLNDNSKWSKHWMVFY